MSAVPPVVNFTWGASGQTLTVTADVNWAGEPPGTLTWSWGDGTASVVPAAEVSAAHTYLTTGQRTVTLTATNAAAMPDSGFSIQTVTLPNIAPTVDFSFRPVGAAVGQDVQFAAAASDPGGAIDTYEWNFGDGSTGTGPNPTHPYSTPGPKTVTLTVTDFDGATATRSHQVLVSPARGDLPPTAGFAFSPRKPRVGDQVEFVSSAQDPEGELRERRWDLDGDGQFDDARGDEVLHTFASAGTHTVRFRAEDAAGNAAVRERSVAVARSGRPRAGFLNPFPVVRITGEVRSRGARIRLLTVRAPRGAQIRLRCRGKACPAKRLRRVVKKERVRFKAFERMLWAGTRLEIFIRKPGTIGKYTRFAIRGGASPLRTDRCLVPGQKKPIRCPG